MTNWRADRLGQLPPYLFVEIDRKKKEAIAAGKDVINLGIGDPDSPTPDFIVERMAKEIRQSDNHRYPNGGGHPDFLDACVGYVDRRFGVEINRTSEITAVIGSKEAIGHLPLAVVNPGEVVLIPDPGYPVYTSATIFAGAVPYLMPLRADNNWLPDFDAIPADVADKAKLMFLNYPNNPTGAVADVAFFEKAVAFAKKHNILIAHDAAYSEVFFEVNPPSILQVNGAADCAVEFHSLSKSFNMTGWRIGFAIGNATAIAALKSVKDNVDSGQFNAVQLTAAEAISNFDHVSVRAMIDLYRERRDIVVAALTECAVTVEKPKASFYVWAKCPIGYTSMDFVAMVLEQVGVVMIPGNGFGTCGEGYFRIALTVDADRMREAMERIKTVSW